MTELMPSLCNDCVARNQCGNDDVKMCISYTKETKIKCDDCKFVEDCVDYGWKDCKKFTSKPSEPITNEEDLRTTNVDDMATMIATKLLELARHEYGMCDVVDREIVLEWLKQPHSEVAE